LGPSPRHHPNQLEYGAEGREKWPAATSIASEVPMKRLDCESFYGITADVLYAATDSGGKMAVF